MYNKLRMFQYLCGKVRRTFEAINKGILLKLLNIRKWRYQLFIHLLELGFNKQHERRIQSAYLIFEVICRMYE
jgi:hypothetical protein